MIQLVKKMIPPSVKRSLRYYYDYWTKRFYCPFCGSFSDKLDIMGLDFPVIAERRIIGAGRREAGCPNCGSTDRERLVYVYLRDCLGIFNSERKYSVLHIAPEANLSKKLRLQKNLTYRCGDKFAEGYTYPSYVENIDLLNPPYENDTFDLVICNHVLEHIEDDVQAMIGIRRVLKRGGRAILQVPISGNTQKTYEEPAIVSKNDREKYFGQSDHVRIYGQDYPDRLEKAGFIVEKIHISANRTYKKLCLNREEIIFVVTK